MIKHNVRTYRRMISFFLVLSFTLCNSFYLETFSYAGPPAKSVVPAATFLKENLLALSLPSHLGVIQDSYSGFQGKTVIYIQDAHALPEAQRSIREIIQYFQEKYGLNLVALEGGEGRLEPLLFRSFPKPEAVKKVFDSYLDKGEISGAIEAAVLNPEEADYYGVDNKSLYQEGIRAFHDAQKGKQKFLDELGAVRKKLDAAKSEIYPPKLLELDRALHDFWQAKDSQRNLPELLRRLSSLKAPQGFDHITALLDEMKGPRAGQELKVKEQIQGLVKILRPRLGGRGEVKGFNEKLQAYQVSEISAGAFGNYLLELAARLEIDLKPFEEIREASKNYPLLLQMQGPVFFKELDAYIKQIKGSLFSSVQAALLDELEARLELLRRLADLELAREDWNAFQKDREKFKPWVFEAFLAGRKKSGVQVGGLTLRSFQASSTADFSIAAHARFYQTALRRDRAFFDNLKSLMRKREAENAIFLSGGFHAEGVTEAFKKEGISYVLISPRMTHVPDESPYLRVMQGNVSWKNYFRVSDGKINLYDAFSRAASDALLNQPYGDEKPRILKSWRDALLRSLANRGEISRAARFTRFIDEAKVATMTEEELSSLKNEWRSRLDRFINQLKFLITSRRLTEEKLARLFVTPAVLPAAVLPLFDTAYDITMLPGFARNPRSEVRTEQQSTAEEQEQLIIPFIAGGFAPPRSEMRRFFESLRDENPDRQLWFLGSLREAAEQWIEDDPAGLAAQASNPSAASVGSISIPQGLLDFISRHPEEILREILRAHEITTEVHPADASVSPVIHPGVIPPSETERAEFAQAISRVGNQIVIPVNPADTEHGMVKLFSNSVSGRNLRVLYPAAIRPADGKVMMERIGKALHRSGGDPNRSFTVLPEGSTLLPAIPKRFRKAEEGPGPEYFEFADDAELIKNLPFVIPMLGLIASAPAELRQIYYEALGFRPDEEREITLIANLKRLIQIAEQAKERLESAA